MRVFLGFIIVFFSIGLGWVGAEISRKVLLVLSEILQILPRPYEYGYFDYLLSHFMIYTVSSIIFVWITIFLPMIIFRKLNFKISWKPSIYLLFLWFAFIQYQTSLMILNTTEADMIMKFTIILANCIGVFWMLLIALKKIK